MSNVFRIVLVTTVIVGVRAVPAAGVSDPNGARDGVWLNGGRLSARVVDASLHQVLVEVGRLCEAHLKWGSDREDVRVSAEFADLPLPDAINRFVPSGNYILGLASTDERCPLRRMFVLGFDASPIWKPALAAETSALPAGTEAAVVDPDPAVRVAAAGSLVDLPLADLRGERLFAQLQADPDPRVREAAQQAEHLWRAGAGEAMLVSRRRHAKDGGSFAEGSPSVAEPWQ